MFDFPKRPDVFSDARVAAADALIQDQRFTDAAPDDLAIVRGYALAELETLRSTNDALDQKAEWIFTVAIAALGGILAYPDTIGLDLFFAVPSIIALLLAMWLAMAARSPVSTAAPLPVWDAMQQARNGRAALEYWLTATTYVALTANQVVNQFKAKTVGHAIRAVVVSAMLACAAASFKALTTR